MNIMLLTVRNVLLPCSDLEGLVTTTRRSAYPDADAITVYLRRDVELVLVTSVYLPADLLVSMPNEIADISRNMVGLYIRDLIHFKVHPCRGIVEYVIPNEYLIPSTDSYPTG